MKETTLNAKRAVCKSFVFASLALFAAALAPRLAPAGEARWLKVSSEPAQLIHVPHEERKEFQEGIKWELYEAYRALVSRTGSSAQFSEEDPATIFLLKGSGVSVDFHGLKLGPGGLSPAAGDVKSLAEGQLKTKMTKLWRITTGGPASPDLALMLVPLWTNLTMTSAGGRAFSVRVSDPHSRPFMEFSVGPYR